ncbi:hypothetical protein [Marinomonas balearica]|uniref:Uncharacterized protein n=1 Tax=Marinomonas balearica TaxID=491947 RepID=A0A4R6M3N1_9GAMM|nr:hypothetical protein [Marinomonas balearica]TDO95794.1 hypothetical protein DFP79_3150 [Marinomonas balearica]
MLSKIFKRTKPRVFMASIVVVPREEWKRSDEEGWFKSEKLDHEAKVIVESVFSSLPPVSSVYEPEGNDLGLDVMIAKVQGAEFTSTMTQPFSLPIFWRPKVQIKSRLYYLKSQRTKKTYSVTVKMPWGEYLAGVLSLRGVFRYKPIFVSKDLEPLLLTACEKLLKKMIRST